MTVNSSNKKTRGPQCVFDCFMRAGAPFCAVCLRQQPSPSPTGSLSI